MCNIAAITSSTGQPVPERLQGEIPETILTPRLIITPLTETDIPDKILALRESWPEMQRWVSWAKDPIEATIAHQENHWRAQYENFKLRTAFYMVARDAVTKEFVSAVTLYSVENDAREMQAGYWTRSKYAGQGLTFEAMTGLIKWGFEIIGAQTMWAQCPVDHAASSGLLTKLGFTFDKVNKDAMVMADGRSVDQKLVVLNDPARIPSLDVKYV